MTTEEEQRFNSQLTQAYIILAVGLVVYLLTSQVVFIYAAAIPGISIYVAALIIWVNEARETYQPLVDALVADIFDRIGR